MIYGNYKKINVLYVRTNKVHVWSILHSIPVPSRVRLPVGPALVMFARQNNIPGPGDKIRHKVILKLMPKATPSQSSSWLLNSSQYHQLVIKL